VSGVWPWLVAVAVVGLALAGWRRQLRMTARHEAAVREVLRVDAETAALETAFRLPDYQREDHGRA
jgi:hypothetical protein